MELLYEATRNTIWMKAPMDRSDALAFLAEINALCKHVSPDSISFQKSKVTDAVLGFRLHIKGFFNGDKQLAKDIARKHGFAVKEEGNEIVIYDVATARKLP